MVTKITQSGSDAKTPDIPKANNKNASTNALVTHLIILAETGLVFIRAFLYNMGAIAQLTAAPKADSSPIIYPLSSLNFDIVIKFSMIK